MSASDPAPNTAGVRGLLGRLIREPVVHFLVLAGLLFAIQALFARDSRDLIVVDAATQEFLFNREEELLLRQLTDDDKQNIIQSFVEEEILVREAVKRGFSDSSRIRALLLQNMRFFIAGDLPEPSDKDLRAYFEANPETFRSPPSLDLKHVMYDADSEVPLDVLEQLNSGTDPAILGDSALNYGKTLRFMDQTRLVQSFGSETAQQVFEKLNEGDGWHGPFTTPTGSVHFLKVIGKNEPRLPDFEVAKDWISTHWMADTSRALMDRELRSLEPDYRIEIEPLQGDKGGA
ncbi:peptidyl-prolyl cis-trans isomerase [Primorskyibacter sp. S87]|uniref:peptidylprolyl isomerase n=1 Tax=Primorskyibacter sp. S87 TaxID=3415126 RepID=UPI003C7BE406